MELMYWVAICVTAGLLGAGVRRKELDEALLGGLIISILLLFVAIQKGFIGMDATAIPVAITASLMFGYASYGVYEQNKQEMAAVQKQTETLEEHDAHCEFCRVMGYGPEDGYEEE